MAPPLKPTRQKLPSLKRAVMVDTINGKVRLRAWPKPRGPNIPDQTRLQVERFQEATKLIKGLKGNIMNRCIEAAKGSSLYPRDIAMKCILNPPWVVDRLDGTTLRHGRPRLESVMFQGFALRGDVDVALPSATGFYPDWPAPIFDTAGFFNAADPDRITIPEGVAVMEFTLAWRRTLTSSQLVNCSLELIGTPAQYPADQVLGSGGGSQVSSGPIPVLPGQQYRMRIFSQAGGTLWGERSYFAGQILATDF